MLKLLDSNAVLEISDIEFPNRAQSDLTVSETEKIHGGTIGGSSVVVFGNGSNPPLVFSRGPNPPSVRFVTSETGGGSSIVVSSDPDDSAIQLIDRQIDDFLWSICFCHD
jgi:hypothetical protein